MRIFSFILCAILTVILSTQISYAQIPANQDNTIYQPALSTETSNGAGSEIYFGMSDLYFRQNWIRRGLIKFDLGHIPYTARVLTAQFSVRMTQNNLASTQTAYLHRVYQAWGEGTSVDASNGLSGAVPSAGDATWTYAQFSTSQWSAAGGYFNQTASTSRTMGALGTYTFGGSGDLIPDVQNWVRYPANNHGWIIRGNESTANSLLGIASSEYGSISYRPGLLITYSDVHITEIFDHPTAQGEFVEIYNSGANAQNLNGWRLQQTNGISTEYTTTLNATSLQSGDLILNPGEYAVIGRGTLAQFTEIYGYAPTTYFQGGAQAPQIDGGEAYNLIDELNSTRDSFGGRTFQFQTSLRHYLRNLATYPNTGTASSSWITDTYSGNPGTDNLAPVANDDAASTDEDTPVEILVYSNDTDSDGTLSTASVTIVTNPTNGSVNNFRGRVTYTPNANYYGTDAFTYTINDNDGATSKRATVRITIRSVNDPPVAVNDRATTNEDTEVEIDVLRNDTDVDGTIDPTSVTISREPVNGRARVLETGTIAYGPNRDYFGYDTLYYRVADNNRAGSNVAMVEIRILPVNDAPQTTADNAITNEEQTVTINVLSNDTDIDGEIDSRTVRITQNPANGSASVGSRGEIIYTPARDFFGQDVLYYTVADNLGATSAATRVTIQVNNINDPPVARDDAVEVNEDGFVVIPIMNNDTDSDGTLVPASIAIVLQPTHGSPVIDYTNGTINYRPAANYYGADYLVYTIQDNNQATSNRATVNITVNPVNDAPVANDDAAATAEDVPVMIPVLANDVDIDGSLVPSSVTVVRVINDVGTTSVNANNGEITFTPNANYNGQAIVQYTVNDNSGATSNVANATITIRSVNDAPVANNDETSVNEDQSVQINVLNNDVDAEGSLDATSVTIVANPANGSVSVNGSTGVITYTPAANFSGNDSFQYTVDDNLGATSNSATVFVRVAEVNDPPVAVDDRAVTDEDTPVDIGVLANDYDIDGTIVTVSINASPANGSVSIQQGGVIRYTPNNNYSGNDTFSYRIWDNDDAQSNSATVAITVRPVNDRPVAQNDNASTEEDTPVDISVLGNDTDDGSLVPSSVQVTSGPANGTTSVNTNTGVIRYTPATNYNGNDSFTYTVNDDGGAASNAATVSVTIRAVNDAPVANDDNATTDEDTPVNINVLANDTDADGSLVPSSVNVTGNPAHGSVNVNTTNGVITYTPTSNYNGSDSFTYTVRDNSNALSNPATVSIRVNNINDRPVAANDNATTDEDIAVDISVLANDNDPDGSLSASTVAIQSNPANGSVSVNLSSGVITYTPTANYNGNDSFTYTVNDNDGATSNTATVSVTVNSVNDLPVAVNDFANTNEDIPVQINVLANDIDVDGTINATTVAIVQNPANGSLSVNGTTGIVTYTPGNGWSGIDNFTYRVNDNTGGTSNTASVRVTVGAVNDPPVAQDDNATTNEDQAVVINILTNDSDVDGTIVASSVVITGNPAHGSTQVNNNNGAVTYTPAQNYNGSDSFTYTVQDDGGATSNQATVSIRIDAVNDAPVAQNDNAATDEDTPVEITVLGNDTDIDGTLAVSSVEVFGAAAHGNTSVNTSTGTITFTPALNYNGGDSFTYRVRDNGGAVSNNATVSVTIRAVNDAPVAQDDNASTDEDIPVQITVTGNDTDVDGTINVTTVNIVQNPSHGSVSVNGTNGIITYSPANGWSGDDSFIYRVNDNQGTTSNAATVRVSVGAVNDAPIAVNDNASTDEDTPVQINVLGNDSDSDGSLVLSSVTVVGNPAHGSASVNTSSGVVTYTPAQNYTGNDSFTYRVRDNGGANSNTATVSVTIRAVNDAPVAQNDNASTDEDTPVQITVTGNDTDVDGTINVTTVAIVQNPAHGSVSVNGTNGIITYTPASGWSGNDSFTYRVNDNQGATSNTATVSVNVGAVNDPPVAANDQVETNEDQAIEISVLVNDVDSDGTLNISSVQITGNPQHGLTSVNSNTGTVTYTPSANYYGQDSFTYTVRDDGGAVSNSATVTITINSINDRPVAVNDQAETLEDIPVEINVTSNDTDVDGTINITTVNITQNPTHGSVTVNGTSGLVTYTPNNGWNGNDSFQYTVSDNQGALSQPATVSVTVGNVNDAPVAANDQIATDEDTAVEIDVLANDSDEDGSLVLSTVTIVSDPEHGSASVNSQSGVITFTPAQNYNGHDQFSYRVNDNDGATSNTALVNITINTVNDLPVAVDDNAQTDEDTEVMIDILANDSDLDGVLATSSVSVKSGPENGSISINPVSGEVTFTPAEGWYGMDTLTYTVKDDQAGESNIARIIIEVISINDPPVIAQVDPFVFNEDDSLSIPVDMLLLLISDPDNAITELSYNFSGMQHIMVVNKESNLIVSAPENWFGEEWIRLIVSDSELSDTSDIQVIVHPVNDLPQITDLPDPLIMTEGNLSFLGLWDYISDVETADSLLKVDLESTSDSLEFQYQKTNGLLTVSLVPGFKGTAILRITVQDDSAGTITDSIRVHHQDVSALADMAGMKIPVKFDLFQNYPNPFNPVTTITYDLPKAQSVRLEVYNILGQRIALLVEEKQNPGHYSISFDTQKYRLASGIYIYRLQAGNYVNTKKMILMR